MPLVLALFGVLSIGYGITIMLVRSGSSFFVVWYLLGIMLLVAAWAAHAGMWSALPDVARRAVVAVIAVALTGLLVTQGLIVGEFDARGEPDLDYIIVLGAQVRADGSPSVLLRHRLDMALDYLRENPHARCIVSGGQGTNEPISEAACMVSYLEGRGIDADRLLREDRSRDTAQNIANSKEMIADARARVGIVTNDFHVFRALCIARHAGLTNSCGIAAPSLAWFQPNNMLRESLCLVKELLAGTI